MGGHIHHDIANEQTWNWIELKSNKYFNAFPKIPQIFYKRMCIADLIYSIDFEDIDFKLTFRKGTITYYIENHLISSRMIIADPGGLISEPSVHSSTLYLDEQSSTPRLATGEEVGLFLS